MNQPKRRMTQEDFELASREFAQDVREGYGDTGILIGADGIKSIPGRHARITPGTAEESSGQVEASHGTGTVGSAFLLSVAEVINETSDLLEPSE